MKNLIVYYSHSGNNEKLAYELKERIGSAIYQVCEQKKRNTISILLDFLFKRNSKLTNSFIDIKEYDNIIFIAPIWGGKIASPMRAFIEREKNSLKKFYYITLCNGEARQKDKITDELYSITQHKPQNITELSINILLPEDQQNKIKHTFSFRINKQDLQRFNETLESFINMVNSYSDAI